MSENKTQDKSSIDKPKIDKKSTTNASDTVVIRSWFVSILFEFSSVVLSLAIIWLAGLGILMNRTSVNLSFVKPHYEHWFSQAFDGKTTEIDSYSARWLKERRVIEIRAKGIRIRDKDGGKQILEGVSGEFRFRNNLLSVPEIVRLNIIGGALTIIRDADKRVQVSLGTPAASGNVGALWQSEVGTTGSNLLEKIESITVNSADIYYQDEYNGLDLTFLHIDGTFRFLGGEILLDTVGVLDMDGESQAAFELQLKTTPDLQVFNGDLAVNNLVPAQIAPMRGSVSILSKLDAPLDLTATVTSAEDGSIQDLKLNLIAGEGQLKTGASYKPFSYARIAAHYDHDAKNIQVQALDIESEALNIMASGSVKNPVGGVNDLLVKPIEFTLNIASARLDPGQKFDGPLSVKDSKMAGKVSLKTRSVNLETIALDFGTFQTNLSAGLTRNSEGVITSITANGVVDGVMSRDQLLGFWPHEFALGGRNWIKNSLKSGQIFNLKIQANLDADDIKNQVIANDNLTLRYDVKGANVQFMRKMPWVRDGAGYGVLQGNGNTFYITSGRVDGLVINKGQVTIPKFLPFGDDFTIELNGAGTVAEMLRVSNFPPFEFSKNYGINPKDFGGVGVIDLHITRPLLVNFDQKRILYNLSGDFTEVNIPIGIGAHKLNGGQMHLRADKDGITVSGPIKLGKWQTTLDWAKPLKYQDIPAKYTLVGTIARDDLDAFGIGLRRHFGGEIGLHISGEGDGLAVRQADIFANFNQAEVNIGRLWHKPKNTKGKLSGRLVLVPGGGGRIENLAINSQGLEIKGQVALAQNFRLISLDLDSAKIADLLDAKITAKPTRAGGLSVGMDGNYFNIAPWVNKAFETQSSSVAAPINLTARLNKIYLDENYILTNAQAEFAHDGNNITNALLRGLTKDGEFLAKIGAPTTGHSRSVRVEIPDASVAMLALLGLNSIEGGKLEIAGKLPPSGQKGGLSGHARLENFTLKQTPVFAQILSLASLQGLADALGGDGLKFNEMEAQFSLEDGVLRIRDGRASGPALGLTGAGDIGIATKILDFDGVLVPSYTVNSLLGDIPLLGDIIVGKKGEGMFALNYALKGPFAKTQITVNPLSALTPGFLRRIFDVKRDGIDDPAVADLIKKQEKSGKQEKQEE